MSDAGSGGASAGPDDLVVAYDFLRAFQRVLGLPRQVSLEELKDALQGVTEADDDQTAQEWSPSGLLDWVHIRLVDILRGEVNTYGNYRFPASPNALTWPELARQLLLVTQAQVAMGMTKEEMGEGVGAWMRVSLDWWLVAQQGRKGARAMVQRLNAAYFHTPQGQGAGQALGGREEEDEEEDEEEEASSKAVGKRRQSSSKGKKTKKEKDEEEGGEGGGDITGEGDSGTAVGEMLAETELDVDVRVGVWRAIVAWALRHCPTLLARVISPPKRGWKGGPRGRRGRKRGGGALGGQRPAKKKVLSALGCRFREEGREYMQDLYTALKVYREKELPSPWCLSLLGLLDAFQPLDIRSALHTAITQVKALLPTANESEGLHVLHEELRSAGSLNHPRRAKEVALRSLLTHLTHLSAQGHDFPPKPQPDPEEVPHEATDPEVQQQQEEGGGGGLKSVKSPAKATAKGRGSKALVRLTPAPPPSEGPNGRSRRRIKRKHYSEDTEDEGEEDEEEEDQQERGGKGGVLSDTDSDEEGTARRRTAKPTPKMLALAQDRAEEAAAMAPTRVSARAASRRASGEGGGGRKGGAQGGRGGRVLETKVPHDSELAKVHGKMPNGRHPVRDHCRAILRLIACGHPELEPFFIPVDPHWLPDYHTIIKRPMDLRTIDRKIEASKYGFDCESLRKDVGQIRTNAYKYNRDPDSPLRPLADQLVLLFDRLYKEWVLDARAGTVVKDFDDDAFFLLAPWGDTCAVCRVDRDECLTLLCDGCGAEYHTYCLDPPLDGLPPEGTDFFCPRRCAVPPPPPRESEEPEGEEDEDEEGGEEEGKEEGEKEEGEKEGGEEGEGAKGEVKAEEQALLKLVEEEEEGEEVDVKGLVLAYLTERHHARMNKRTPDLEEPNLGRLMLKDRRARQLCRTDPEADLSVLGVTLLKDRGPLAGLHEGAVVDYHPDTGYGVVYPSDGSRDALSPTDLGSLRESSALWQQRANRLVLDCRTALSLGKALHTPYMQQEGEGEGEGEGEEGGDPMGLSGCVMQAVGALGDRDYYGMDWRDKARLLRALCEAAAQTRMLRELYLESAMQEIDNNSSIRDAKEEKACLLAQSKIAGQPLPRGTDLIATDKQQRQYFLCHDDPDSPTLLCRSPSGHWHSYAPHVDKASLSLLTHSLSSGPSPPPSPKAHKTTTNARPAKSSAKLRLRSAAPVPSKPRPLSDEDSALLTLLLDACLPPPRRKGQAKKTTQAQEEEEDQPLDMPCCRLYRVASKGSENGDPCPVCPNCTLRPPDSSVAFWSTLYRTSTTKKVYNCSGGVYLSMVRVSLISLIDSIPPHVWGDGLDGNVMGSKDMRLLWKDFVNAANNPQALMQACLILEQCVPRPFLKPWWQREWSSPSTATRRPATCHAVAHRVYTLHRAINMERDAEGGKGDKADRAADRGDAGEDARMLE